MTKYSVTLKSGTKFEAETIAENEVDAIRSQRFVRETDTVTFLKTVAKGNVYIVETKGQKYVSAVIPVLVTKL